MKTEHQIQNAIFRAFGTRSDMRIWRQNTGAAHLKGGQMVRFGIKGAADITGIVPVELTLACPHCGGLLTTPTLGVRLEIEVKSPTGRQSKEQRWYQQMIERFGGIYVLARSVEEVEEELRNATTPERQDVG